MFRWIIALLVALYISGCLPLPGPEEPEPPSPPTTTCAKVCDHYRGMACEEGDPTPEGHTCEEVCDNLVDSEVPGVEDNLQCVLKTNTCKEAKECE
jgi:hypothetical protein